MTRDPMLSIHRSHTTSPCGGDCLSVFFVLDIPRSKNTIDIGLDGSWLGDDISRLVQC
jgi:hypothetical protein